MSAIERAPGSLFSYWALGLANLAANDLEAAREELEKATAMSGLERHPWPEALIGYVDAVSGREAEARRIGAELESRSHRQFISPILIALIHQALGDFEVALDRVEKGIEARDPWVVLMGRWPRAWDRLRQEPQFRHMLDRVGMFGPRRLPAG